MEELRGEERRDSAQGVTHETLARDGRGGVLAVAVRGERVAGLEDEEDTDGDEGEGDDGAGPHEVAILSEGVDEETDREPDGAEEGTVETGFGLHAAVVGDTERVVLADLEEIHAESDGGTDTERDVGETGDTLAPAVLLLEGDGNDGQEEEGQEPGEGDPETEEEHDWFGEEHLDGLDRRVVEHLLDTGGLELSAGDVAVVTGGLAEGLGTLVQGDRATGLTEEDDDGDTERDVGETLNTLNPAPAEGLVDETGVDGGTHGTQDSDIGE